jgi:hypothetical protein
MVNLFILWGLWEFVEDRPDSATKRPSLVSGQLLKIGTNKECVNASQTTPGRNTFAMVEGWPMSMAGDQPVLTVCTCRVAGPLPSGYFPVRHIAYFWHEQGCQCSDSIEATSNCRT